LLQELGREPLKAFEASPRYPKYCMAAQDGGKEPSRVLFSRLKKRICKYSAHLSASSWSDDKAKLL